MRRRPHLPRSLRSRLVAGLLVVAAIGLVVFGAITYAEQRSFLRERVEQQAASGSPAVIGAYNDQLRGGSGRRGPGGSPFSTLPSGSYGEIRQGDGVTALGSPVRFLPPGESSRTAATPRLPRRVTSGEKLTVESANGGSDFYVAVRALPDFDTGATFYVITAVPLTDVDATLNRLLLIEGIVAAVVLLVLGALTWALVRVGLRPLDRITTTAGSLAAGELDTRVEPAEPTTEVGRLGLALNGMLGRLEEAFAEREASEGRLRTFLADASHELRTPLASIRGYAELFRMGAAREPRDVAKAMDRIESESARMGTLVEDLLVLARMDEVRTRALEPIDVGELAQDAVDDVRAAAPDRDVALRLEEPTIAVADADGVRQVLANLLRNATIHTPAGTPIEVAVGPSARHAERLAVQVRDHGPGLPHADPNMVFGRFWRAEGGRKQGPAGAGLGLSIVAGIVAAQGGTTSAENAPDGGAVFRIELPLAGEGTDDEREPERDGLWAQSASADARPVP